MILIIIKKYLKKLIVSQEQDRNVYDKMFQFSDTMYVIKTVSK